ncbi:hypothetical protein Y032_0001g450 [Ancylostoma ceylanicum]|uniref:Type I phosphodiesterase / nucleotide pyrophosphatase n=1 Tax=Ancylostoma ceylanicum TaxID=53326 RepID=A0A016W669_9BILA|nr:hypothetical protein Y032_0001g450 [Ancylostoma ceylanicum]
MSLHVEEEYNKLLRLEFSSLLALIEERAAKGRSAVKNCPPATMRSSSFVHGTDEVTPMVTTEGSVRNNGAILSVSSFSPEKGRQDVSAARFRHLYILVAILLVMVLIGVIVTAVVAVRLGHMEKQVERAQAQLPRNVKEALDNFKLPMTWQFLPQSTAPPNVPPIQAEVHEPQPQPKEQQQYQRTKECRTECLRKDISKPPLVILSLDGFAREYLDRFTVGALEYMTKCGATAERVYPPFPSRTFPSHYTMVTGLYPESHGIVDNNIFDPSISDKMESMKRGNVDAFYLGDPIWNIYKRSGGRAACLYWPGCAFNISGLRPDISPPYNKDLPFRNRFDMIVDWLLMPPETCPGLITAYLDQPDSAGHYQIDDKDIEFQLAILDTNLRYLMDRLDDKGLLGCINLVIVSDHGMQKTNNTHYFSNIIKDPGIIPASGVIGRIHKHRSPAPVDELMKPFECERGNRWKVYQRSTMPTRKHYQKSQRVGDVIVEGMLGTSFYRSPADDWFLKGDHGYDYLRSPMQTVFFAMGPSIKKGVVLPAVQNIEYLNLWIGERIICQNLVTKPLHAQKTGQQA